MTPSNRRRRPRAPSVDQQALADVRQMKRQLQQLVAARVNGLNLDGSPITLNGKHLNTLFGAASPGGRIPEQPVPSNTWWLQWEAHQPAFALTPPPIIGVREVAFSAVAPQLWGGQLWHNEQTATGVSAAWTDWHVLSQVGNKALQLVALAAHPGRADARGDGRARTTRSGTTSRPRPGYPRPGPTGTSCPTRGTRQRSWRWRLTRTGGCTR